MTSAQSQEELKAAITGALKALKEQGREERVATAYSRKEVSEFDSLDRLRFLRNSHMEGLSRYYAMHPSADVGPGVYIVLSILSDNGKYGAASVQIGRIAEYLSRHRRTVEKAIQSLVNDGLLRKEERDGTTTLYWPVYSRSIGLTVQATWFLDAHAPAPERGPGRPKKTPGDSDRTFSEKPPASQNKTPGDSGENPRPHVPHESTKDDSTNESTKEGGEQARQPAPPTKPPSRKTRLPDGATLSDGDMAYATSKGLTPEEAWQEHEAFCKHHRSNGSAMASWEDAWGTWILKAIKWGHVGVAKRGAGNKSGGFIRAAQVARGRVNMSEIMKNYRGD